jgi:two-component system, cell cycle sensor histidine kinase and response regulator CckA
LSVALSALVGLWLRPFTYHWPYLSFYGAVLISLFYGGFGPGIVSSILSALVTNFLFLPPYSHFSFDLPNIAGGTYFCLSFGFICWLIDTRWERAERQIETTEDELRESEERFQLFVEHAPAALAMFDREMHYLHVSRRWRTDYGLGERDLRGVSHYEVFPEVPERWRNAHRRGLAGEVLREEDDRWERADGSVQTERWEIRPWLDKTGAIGGIVIFTEDITERKRAERLFRESQEDYRTLFDSMDEGFCTIEVLFNENDEPVDFRFLEVNPAFEKQTGIQNARGRRVREIIPHLEEYWFATYGKIALTGKPARFESEAAQLHRCYDVHAFRIGEPREKKVAVFFNDISERKQTEERLREYQRVVEGLEEMIVVVDRQYRYLIANTAFLNFCAMSAKQVIGHFVEEVVGKDVFAATVKEKMDQCFLGTVVHYEFTYDSPNLRRREFFVSYFPIASRSGVDRIACVLQDITERKWAEEELRKSEERFSKAFRNSPVAITISTEEEGRYLDVNDAFLLMLGWQRRDVIGHTAAELHFWAEPLDRAEMLRQVKEAEQVAKLNIRYKTAKGETREAEVWAEPIELDGQRCVLAITRDVTEAQRLEAQFRQAQKMEAVGQLAGGVAHDFNNLLGVILGYTDLSLSLTAPGSSANRNLEQIKKASNRAVALTRQLLAFSRQQVVFPRVLDLNEVVQNLIIMLRRLVSEEIVVSFRPAVPIDSIKADPGQIEQILMNLAVNARDAMPNGGEILIETGNAELDEDYVSLHSGSRAGQHVVLTVSDTGCGMDENVKSKLFEPFFTTKGVGKGSGLGLSTVYGIVKQNGGTIFVYSEPGNGTTFKIYFPAVALKAEHLTQPHEDVESRGGSETILVVEDDESLRELTARMLRDAGYQVIEARDTDNALDIVRTSRPRIDLLLTDVIMPGGTGIELMEQAKALRPKLRSVFMSGYTGDLVSQRGASIQEVSFLEKPFSRNSLLNKIYSALHSE